MSVTPVERIVRPLTPRLEQVRRLYAGGMRREQIAVHLGLALGTVNIHLVLIRRRGVDLPRQTNLPPRRGPEFIAAQKREKREATLAHLPDKDETRSEARIRIDADVAAGRRCARCWSPRPCDLHP